MTEHVGVSGVWKNVAEQWVGVDNVWKRITQKWVGVDGAWKLFWSAVFAPSVSISATTIAPTPAAVAIQFYSDGTIKTFRGGVQISTLTWFQGDGGSGFDVYLSGTGTTPAGQPLDQWLNLGTTRDWGLTANSPAPKSFTGTYQIRATGGGDTLASGSFGLSAVQELS
jgi:hypothetical protein